MIRASGSVKFRCAFGSGTADSAARGAAVAASSSLRPAFAAFSRAFAAALSRACFSRSALALRILASRDSRRASSPCRSSPRLSGPCAASSAASMRSASASMSPTSAASRASAWFIRP